MDAHPLAEAFAHGDLLIKGEFLPGSNYTFLVEVQHRGQRHAAVYKPQKGEQPLWDFPQGTLAQREVAAYWVSESLGLHFVPYTILRPDGPFGPGALQAFIPHDPSYHYFRFSPEDRARLRPVVLFDLLVNNADRKGSHILIETGSRDLWLIDHGLCFHVEEKLRTVIWDFVGEPIPAFLLEATQRLVEQLTTPSQLHKRLSALLSATEIEALRQRAEFLLANPVFPAPPAYRRAIPYPPF
uniref:Hypothetical conserved protein n=1 Tax=uncultured Chloroflexota bacterium TaxID=166587 RepID=H5SMV2_9CHLR|nr:hypothetical conserved protein [uncultured Chloroflexota bacterium]